MKNLDISKLRHGTTLVKRGFAKMQKGGVVMDVVTADQARIAEEAGAVAVMALERVPADIRADGGVARMSDPLVIEEIIDAVSIPVMAKARIGHFVEAEELQALGVDMVDESEVLTPADPFYHIDKKEFTVPFVCGCRNLGEAVRRIWEGAAMMRTKGEAGTGNIVEAMRHQRMVQTAIHSLKDVGSSELSVVAEMYAESYVDAFETLTDTPVTDDSLVFGNHSYCQVKKEIAEILGEIKKMQRLPTVNFAAGGIATPADAALMMKMGSDGVFVGSGIFKSEKPSIRAKAIVEAVAHYDDAKILAKVSRGLGKAMESQEIENLEVRLAERGW